jgi:hypothetical protein
MIYAVKAEQSAQCSQHETTLIVLFKLKYLDYNLNR